MNARIRALLDTYLSQEGDSIRYIISIVYDRTKEVSLRIKYVDAGDNYHNIGWNDRGMLTFE